MNREAREGLEKLKGIELSGSLSLRLSKLERAVKEMQGQLKRLAAAAKSKARASKKKPKGRIN